MNAPELQHMRAAACGHIAAGGCWARSLTGRHRCPAVLSASRAHAGSGAPRMTMRRPRVLEDVGIVEGVCLGGPSPADMSPLAFPGSPTRGTTPSTCLVHRRQVTTCQIGAARPKTLGAARRGPASHQHRAGGSPQFARCGLGLIQPLDAVRLVLF